MQANYKQNFNFNLKYSTLYFASEVLCALRGFLKERQGGKNNIIFSMPYVEIP